MEVSSWRVRTVRLRVLAFITVSATAVISFTSVQSLAARAGFGWTDWLFPLSLDAVAAFAMDVWMRHGRAARSAGALALTAIGLSLAGNVSWHYLASGVLAAILGAIPPAMLAWLLLVLHKHSAPEPALAPALAPVPGPPLEYRPAPADPAVPVPVVTEPQPAPRHPVDPVSPTPTTPAPVREVAPTPRPVPAESITERTLVMAPISMTEIGTKVPAVPVRDRAKVSPASTGRRLTTVPSGPLSELTDAELAEMARTWDRVSRRRVMQEFGVGSSRATKIANLAKGA
jgi:hypothetical protein